MNLSLTISLFIISAFQILESTQFLIRDFSCKTPNGESGKCVDLHECEPIHNNIKENNYILTQKLRQFIKEHTCGFTEQQLKVCCSNAPVTNNIENHYFDHNNRLPKKSNKVMHKNAKLLPLKCGMNNNRNMASFETKTSLTKLNIQKATLNEFPWMAILSYNSDKGTTFRCTGTIINERYILTSATCIDQHLLSVRIGEHNIAETYDCERDDFNILKCSSPVQDIDIEKAFRHEEFKFSSTRNDIGLIRLSKPINIYTENVKAICLPLQNSSTTVDALHIPLTLTGWGVTKNNFKSEVLLKAEVSTISPNDCSKAYKIWSYDPVLSDELFCSIGQPNNKRDLCCGDIGSPLQMLNGMLYTQYGIVSVGLKSCAKKPIPIINTKVERYIDWILDNIEP